MEPYGSERERRDLRAATRAIENSPVRGHSNGHRTAAPAAGSQPTTSRPPVCIVRTAADAAAVTTYGGLPIVADQWQPRDAGEIAQRTVVVFEPPPGERWPAVIAALEAALPIAKRVTTLRLPDDATLAQFSAAGGTNAALNALLGKAQPLTPADLENLRSRWGGPEIAGGGATQELSGDADWKASLIGNQNGDPKPLLANAITALRHAPEWAGVLAFNEFSGATVALKPAPWPRASAGEKWSDQEDRLTANWLQHHGIYVSIEVAGQAVQAAAQDHKFHPVREYLESLRWDRTKRVDTWLSLYLGAEQSEYTSAVGARWLISAVARIYEPGAKADHVLILEGPQGAGKSTALKTLAGEWFTDDIGELGSKDASLQIRGVWIVELAELDSISRAETSRVKSFTSRSTDHFRPPYGKRAIDLPRQCVFAGTVNHNTYLRDETGGRRFWPVCCTRIRLRELARDRDQLWAEARERFRAGTAWWIDSSDLSRLAAHEQESRYEGDPWDEIIAQWLLNPAERLDNQGHPVGPFASKPGSVSITDVLTHGIGKRQEQWTQADKNRVGRSLRALGWERYRERVGTDLEWRFRKAER